MYILLFVKAAKSLAFANCLFPITGCAIATGYLYGSLAKSCAITPEGEETFFNYTALGFAFVETFAFMAIGGALTVAFVL